MINNTLATDLPVIEVPPESRGLSDEEIVAASESRQKKSENSYRPSKKEREAKKLQQIQEKMQTFAKKMDVESPEPPKQPVQASLETKPSESFKDLFAKHFESAGVSTERSKPAEIVVRSSISSTPKPASGRVLTGKFMFGKKIAPSSATIVNAADLERERAEERAKKILLQQKAKLVKTPAPLQYDSEGNPIKRKRGRPRKNPIE